MSAHSGSQSPKSEGADAILEDAIVKTPPDETVPAAPLSVSDEVKPDPDAPTPSATPAPSKKKAGPQLIGDLPKAEEQALKTFVKLEENYYQYSTLGRSREALESMTCDCQFDPKVDRPWVACGHGSDCINRLTQVECMPEDCRCKSYCQNQRFQRKRYANIDVVLTEKKGFGLRAAEDLERDAFIYEYIGDVVSNPTFLKRMRLYAEEGLQHFYFMMLQRDEYIDATKRGGFGRFANHSCNPNCYVAKWTVGDHVRMGIFASRKILANEELTFNYNVDRYGHKAQPCYCGEPNCVGFIGGKTQTDLGGMDDLYLDALGISEEVDRLQLKGSKKKKSRKLDEDYMPVMKPLTEKEVPKVIQAMRQTQSKKVLFKLLTRIKISEDQSALRQVMRLRGFSLMTNILEDNASNTEIITLALECMTTWPLLQRNKVDDSKISSPVSVCAQSENETIKELAQKLLDHWSTLETGYRIPKRLKPNGDEQDNSHLMSSPSYEDSRPTKKNRNGDTRNGLFHAFEAIELDIKPLGTSAAGGAANRDSNKSQQQQVSSSTPSEAQDKAAVTSIKEAQPAAVSYQFSKDDIQAVIARATAAATAESAATPSPSAVSRSKESGGGGSSSSSKRRKEGKERKKETSEEKEVNREKRLKKLISAIVVKCLSKYSKELSKDKFKKYAEELTNIIAEKEKKLPGYRDLKLDALSEDKQTKIKKFAKEYIAKLVRKLKKAKTGDPTKADDDGLKPSTSTAGSSVTPNSTVDVAEGGNNDGDDDIAAGMDVDDGDDREDVEMVSSEDEGDNDSNVARGSEAKDTVMQSPALLTPATADNSPSQQQQQQPPALTSSDPRRRGHNWDPQKSSLEVS